MTRVLVTGGGGFLGSHLVDRLRADGLDPFVAPVSVEEQAPCRKLVPSRSSTATVRSCRSSNEASGAPSWAPLFTREKRHASFHEVSGLPGTATRRDVTDVWL